MALDNPIRRWIGATRRPDDRARGAEEVAGRLGLRLLGTIPPAPGPRATGRDLGPFLESLDRIRDSAFSGPGRLVLVGSPGVGDGKTLVASQLAGRCSAAGMLTLLVEANPRNPTLARMFDRAEDRGLSEVLAGEIAAEEAIRPVVEAGFYFLPAGSGRDVPDGRRDVDALSTLMGRARASFDVVIVDGPPTPALGRSVDGALLVIRGEARRPEVERAAVDLAEAGAAILGVVANRVRGRWIEDKVKKVIL